MIASHNDPSDTSAPGEHPRRDRGVWTVIRPALASTSAITAVLYYFGWTYTSAQATYFGVTPNFFELDTTGYVLRSITAAYLMLAVGPVIALAVLVVWRPISGWIMRHDRARAVTRYCFTGLAVLLAVIGFVDLWKSPVGATWLGGRLALAGGTLLLASWSLRQGVEQRASKWLALAVFGIGGFALVTVSAADTGRDRAEQLTQDVSGLADVVMYSDRPLVMLGVHEVRADVVRHAEGPPTYRARCLKLVMRIGDTLVMTPADYANDAAANVIYTFDATTVRVDFDRRAAAARRRSDCLRAGG